MATIAILLIAALLIAMVVHSVKNQTSFFKYILFLWGLLSFFYAAFVLVSAKSAIHEIQGGVALLIGTIACGLAAIIDNLDDLRKANHEQKSAHVHPPLVPSRYSSLTEKHLAELEQDFLAERIGPDGTVR